MTLDELKEKLIKTEEKDYDPEGMHIEQDELLLEYINDPEVTEIFNRTSKWYA